MRTGFGDTDAETSAAHLKLLRAASADRRLALALALSTSVMSLARDAGARRLPGASQEEIAIRFVATCYGASLAEDVRAALRGRRS